MKKTGTLVGLIFLFAIAILTLPQSEPSKEKGKIPNEYFFLQRSYPIGEIPHDAYQKALAEARALRSGGVPAGDSRTPHRDQSSTPSRWGGAWIPSGPTNIGGRITAVDIHPDRPNVIYAGAAAGGVLRSTDTGATWTFLMDDGPSLSIGDLDIDPNDDQHIVVGTGEANASGDSYPGTGVYISHDGGDSWSFSGLAETRHIGRVVISPANSDHIYVAAMGTLFGTNPERGVYRSRDGGDSWELVLFVSDSTGCIDLALNPDNPSILYAAMWERIRRPTARRVGGVTSGVYRSTNGGDTWTLLGNGLPAPGATVGRIGLDISESNPAVVYAIYADDPGYFMGLYKTSNGGDSWSRVNDGALSDLYSSYGWYFGNVRVDPNLPDRIYAMGLYGYKSTNSGGSWSGVTFSVHADQHDWWISPNNSNWIISAHDGGLDISTNGGGTWSKVYNLPVTQFYAGTIDYTYPERLYGGTQDNGTLRTLTGGLDDWDEILGGDGFYVIVDPTNPNTIYAEWQWGNLNKSVDGGFYFSDALNGISSSNRRNWSTPVVMDPSDPQTLYYGTYKIYKTTNGASYWSPISPDLSNGPGSGNLTFGTITTIAVAPSDPAVIYAGLDDGNVWRTLNGGSEWLKVSGDLPVRWVTRVAVDPLDPLTAYVTLSGYRQDESLPHIFRTTDAGALWEDISGNLPEVPINAVVIDPEHSTWLYVATDAGVYFTGDLGATWAALGEGLPLVTVHDLTLHAPTRTLVAATHGRSLFRLNLGTVSAPEHENTAWRLLRIEPPSPTPFSLLTTLRFHLETAHTVTASVYDVRGRRVKSWEYVSYPAGSHSLVWDGCDESGRRLSSGTYWIRLRAGDENRSVRALLVD